MKNEEYLDKIKKLSKDFSNDLNETNPSYAESEAIYSLKNYVDKRFDLLVEYLGQFL